MSEVIVEDQNEEIPPSHHLTESQHTKVKYIDESDHWSLGCTFS